MAYVGYTERLCQAIVSGDVEAIKKFLANKDSNPDRRDYTGRTPLQLACISSTPEVVQCLVDHGARLIARMADGKTALHLAAARGNVEIIRILLTKSNENEEAETRKEGSKKKITNKQTKIEDEDDEMRDADDASHTSASYVKVEKEEKDDDDAHESFEESEEPDIYDINAIAWDSLASPLQLAILHGHTDVVTELVSSFGADISMPIKILNDWNRQPQASILNLVLVLALPLDKARSMSQTLLKLGASPAQADLTQSTPLHYIAQSSYSDLLDVYLEHDGPALQRAINHLALTSDNSFRTYRIFFSALMNAIAAQNHTSAKKLLEVGAKPKFELEYLMSAIKSQLPDFHRVRGVVEQVKNGVKQPILYAVEKDLPLIALELLRRGADPNSEEATGGQTKYMTILTGVRNSLKSKREFLHDDREGTPYFMRFWNRPAVVDKEDESYLAEYLPSSYQRFFAIHQLKDAREERRKYDELIGGQKTTIAELGLNEKKAAVARLLREFELLEKELLARGAKTVEELHPDLILPPAHHKPTVQDQEKTFKIEFKFQTHVLTDTEREGYLQLYEHFTLQLFHSN